MREEIKSIEYHPDVRGPAKRGRPFFSIRRRVDPDAMQKVREEYGRFVREKVEFELKAWFVLLVVILIVLGILLALAP